MARQEDGTVMLRAVLSCFAALSISRPIQRDPSLRLRVTRRGEASSVDASWATARVAPTIYGLGLIVIREVCNGATYFGDYIAGSGD
jgi:hypothetical protein